MISSKNKASLYSQDKHFISHLAATKRGQSGSPIIDRNGKVIGIHIGKYPEGEKVRNLGIKIREEMI